MNAATHTRLRMQYGQGGERLVDDAFFLRNVKVLESAFDGQFHYGMFYAFVKLKEQEVKNLVRRVSVICMQDRKIFIYLFVNSTSAFRQVWICECVLQGQQLASAKFIPIFAKRVKISH